ncbi:MAG: hypothetical protein U1E78_11485 [Gammaproteobacteria bacterium]
MKSKLAAAVAILSLVALTACNKPAEETKKEEPAQTTQSAPAQDTSTEQAAPTSSTTQE